MPNRRALAYIFAGIPAVIGIGFVARYAFVTSDTAIDGAANAFLFGMIAAGAFIGPAVVVAVAGNRRHGAAVLLGILTALAILANWSHTLGAIAQRGAGTEAESAKAKEDMADDRAELKRLTAERVALQFTPADADAVAAARAAVKTTERARIAECGDGDPRQRGKNCRTKEDAETAATDRLTAAVANKAATDRAAKLDTDLAGIRARLAKAPAVKTDNALGEALGRLVPGLSAASAATFQQGLVSAIAELLIAAGLALPELLRREPQPARREVDVADAAPSREEAPTAPTAPPLDRAPSIAGVTLSAPPKPATTGGVAAFMLACLPRAQGQDAPLTAIYARYRRWCDEIEPAAAPEDAATFAEHFKVVSERVRLRTEKRGNRIVVRDVQLVA